MNVGLNVNLISTFDRYLYRELVIGIQERGWQVDHEHGLLFPTEYVRPGALDVFVTWIQNRAELRNLTASGVPILNFTYLLPTPEVHQVTHDQEGIGEQAAEYLTELGRTCAAVLGSSLAYSKERAKGFQCRWRQYRKPAPSLVIRSHTQIPQVLGDLLSQETLPDALFCTSDELALYAITFLETQGCRIPHDLAVIGVGHEEIHSLCLAREITSVVTDHTHLARKILEQLDRIHGDPACEPTLERVPPREIFQGETCCRVLPEDPGLRSAMEVLLLDQLRQVDLDTLAKAAGMSRRNFERLFKLETGMTAGCAIREARVSLAKRLLVNTRISIETVAEECGYADRYHFSVRFKKDTGQTPAAYRNRIQRLQG